jgi:hypothetical protein
METLKKLGWKKVGALTEDGQKYSDYISAMQGGIILFTLL